MFTLRERGSKFVERRITKVTPLSAGRAAIPLETPLSKACAAFTQVSFHVRAKVVDLVRKLSFCEVNAASVD